MLILDLFAEGTNTGIKRIANANDRYSYEEIIWIYGVVQQVPGNLDGQLQVSRLSRAWEDATFRSILVAAGVPDRDAEDPTALTRIAPNKSNIVSSGVELLRILRMTRTTFEAQARVRNQLVQRISARLILDPRLKMEYEEFFLTYASCMDEFEKRKFQLIRSFTATIMHDSNKKALSIVEQCPELVAKVWIKNQLPKFWPKTVHSKVAPRADQRNFTRKKFSLA